MDEVYDKTITICNKLKKADILNGTVDTWHKKVIHNAEHRKVTVRSVSGSVISFGQSVKVLIPFGNGYLPYKTWKADTTKGYTVSLGDVIFLDMELVEVPTSSNLPTLKVLYGAIECKVIDVVDDNGIATVQVRIEGA